MKSIVIVGVAGQSHTLLADLLHWHGLSIFQVDGGHALLPLLGFISPELIIIESVDRAERVCDRIHRSPILRNVPVVICADRRRSGGSADAYLCRPYTAEDMFAAIQTLCPLATLSSGSVVTPAGVDV